MPFVFLTNQKFHIGKTFHTEDLSGANREAIAMAGPQAVEVEEFLEAVRREEFPDAPPRMESISAIPWPEKGEAPDPYKQSTDPSKPRAHRDRPVMPDPVGASFCYYISNPEPRNGTVLWMVDEHVVQELSEQWPDIAGTDEAGERAREYWGGVVRFEQGSASFLVHGPVLIDEPCPGGGGAFAKHEEYESPRDEDEGDFWRELAEDVDIYGSPSRE